MVYEGASRPAGHIEVRELLAANLRRLRIARHLSLSELARATAISKATLSGIENGRANPTVETLAALAGALRISVTELLEELPAGDIRVLRAGDGPAAPGDGRAARLLEAASAPARADLGELALAALSRQEAEAAAAGARVGVYVLEGTLIAGPVERSTELGPGDYISFPADVPHVYETSRGAARALLLTLTPGPG